MNLKIEVATEKDFDEILKLKQDIWNNMDNKEWYFIDETNKEFLKRELENDGVIIKVLDNDKIVAFLIMEVNLKKDDKILKLTSLENEYTKCIKFRNVAVHPEYRGNNLQMKMGIVAEEIMLKKRDIKYMLSNVHPDNIASIKSLQKLGYEVVCQTKMYNGKDRVILLKKIN